MVRRRRIISNDSRMDEENEQIDIESNEDNVGEVDVGFHDSSTPMPDIRIEHQDHDGPEMDNEREGEYFLVQGNTLVEDVNRVGQCFKTGQHRGVQDEMAKKNIRFEPKFHHKEGRGESSNKSLKDLSKKKRSKSKSKSKSSSRSGSGKKDSRRKDNDDNKSPGKKEKGGDKPGNNNNHSSNSSNSYPYSNSGIGERQKEKSQNIKDTVNKHDDGRISKNLPSQRLKIENRRESDSLSSLNCNFDDFNEQFEDEEFKKFLNFKPESINAFANDPLYKDFDKAKSNDEKIDEFDFDHLDLDGDERFEDAVLFPDDTQGSNRINYEFVLTAPKKKELRKRRTSKDELYCIRKNMNKYLRRRGYKNKNYEEIPKEICKDDLLSKIDPSVVSPCLISYGSKYEIQNIGKELERFWQFYLYLKEKEFELSLDLKQLLIPTLLYFYKEAVSSSLVPQAQKLYNEFGKKFLQEDDSKENQSAFNLMKFNSVYLNGYQPEETKEFEVSELAFQSLKRFFSSEKFSQPGLLFILTNHFTIKLKESQELIDNFQNGKYSDKDSSFDSDEEFSLSGSSLNGKFNSHGSVEKAGIDCSDNEENGAREENSDEIDQYDSAEENNNFSYLSNPHNRLEEFERSGEFYGSDRSKPVEECNNQIPNINAFNHNEEKNENGEDKPVGYNLSSYINSTRGVEENARENNYNSKEDYLDKNGNSSPDDDLELKELEEFYSLESDELRELDEMLDGKDDTDIGNNSWTPYVSVYTTHQRSICAAVSKHSSMVAFGTSRNGLIISHTEAAKIFTGFSSTEFEEEEEEDDGNEIVIENGFQETPGQEENLHDNDKDGEEDEFEFGEREEDPRKSQAIYGIVFHPKRKLIFTAGEDTLVRAWAIEDDEEFKCMTIYHGHSGPVWCIDITKNGDLIGTGSMDRTVSIWIPESSVSVRILVGHNSDVDCVKFHPNGVYIASGSRDKSIRLWSVNDGNLVRIFTGVNFGVLTLAFHFSGKFIISGGEEKMIRIWDVAESELKVKISTREPVRDIATHKDILACCFPTSIWILNLNKFFSQLDAEEWSLDPPSVIETSSQSLLKIHFKDKKNIFCLGADPERPVRPCASTPNPETHLSITSPLSNKLPSVPSNSTGETFKILLQPPSTPTIFKIEDSDSTIKEEESTTLRILPSTFEDEQENSNFVIQIREKEEGGNGSILDAFGEDFLGKREFETENKTFYANVHVEDPGMLLSDADLDVLLKEDSVGEQKDEEFIPTYKGSRSKEAGPTTSLQASKPKVLFKGYSLSKTSVYDDPLLPYEFEDEEDERGRRESSP